MLSKEDYQDALAALEKEKIWQEKREQILQRLVEQEAASRKTLDPEAILAVHMTQYFPHKGVIVPRGSAAPLNYMGKPAYFPRETLHFTLNGIVSAHPGNDWSEMKFAVLIPLHLIINRVYYLLPGDTWIFGKLVLPEGSEIIGKTKDLREMDGGKAQLISLENDEILEKAVEKRIRLKGYIFAKIGTRSWFFSPEESEEVIRIIGKGHDIMDESNFGDAAVALGKTIGSHMNSLFGEIEQFSHRRLYPILYQQEGGFGVIIHVVYECGAYLSQLKSFIRERHRVGYQIHEREALEKIVAFLENSKKEIKKILEKKFPIRKVEHLSAKEKKYLLDEYRLLEKLKKNIDENTKKHIEKKLSGKAIAVYNLHRNLKGLLDGFETFSENTEYKKVLEDEIEYLSVQLASIFAQTAEQPTIANIEKLERIMVDAVAKLTELWNFVHNLKKMAV